MPSVAKLCVLRKRIRQCEITRDEFDLWVFDAFASWDFACAVAAWAPSILELISSEKTD